MEGQIQTGNGGFGSVSTVGGAMTRYPIEFAHDSKTFFTCCGNNVRVLSCATGSALSMFCGHTEEVTQVLRNPADPTQIFTSSLDGTVRRWDTKTGQSLNEYKVGSPILHMCSSKGLPGYLIVNVDPKYHSTMTRSSCRVMSLNLSTGAVGHLYKSRDCKDITIDPRGKYILSVSGHSVFIFSLETKTLLKHHHIRALRTVCCHPTDAYFATGDELGQVILWYQYESAETVVTSSLHWHAHEVAATVFSDDGAYLLTGGEESVLVLWQLDTGHRQYLPRLGSAILNIALSPNGSYYGIACADNAVRLIGAISSRVEQSSIGLQRAHLLKHVPRRLLTRLAVDPITNSVVLSGVPGSVQFFDVFQDKHVRSLCVTGRNNISRVEHEVAIPPRIEFTAFSHDGMWLATVERLSDGKHSERVCLKFWRFDLQLNEFVLNTRINDVHRYAVTSIEFHPTKYIAVTASADHTFKLWQLENRSLDNTIAERHRKDEENTRSNTSSGAAYGDQKKQLSMWKCELVGSYKKFTIHDVSFSADGSLLAVTFGQIVTLWDVQTCSLSHTLVHPSPGEHIHHVQFLDDGPFVVACSRTRVFVWNVLTLSLWWSFALPLVNLVKVPHTSRFIAYIHGKSSPNNPAASANNNNNNDNNNNNNSAGGGGGGGDKGKEKKRGKGKKKDRIVDNAQGRRLLILFDATSPKPLRVWNTADMEETRMGTNVYTEMCCVEKGNRVFVTYVTRGHKMKRIAITSEEEEEGQNEGEEKVQVNGSDAEKDMQVSEFSRLYGSATSSNASGAKSSASLSEYDSLMATTMTGNITQTPSRSSANNNKFSNLLGTNSIAAQLRIPNSTSKNKKKRKKTDAGASSSATGTETDTDTPSTASSSRTSNPYMQSMGGMFALGGAKKAKTASMTPASKNKKKKMSPDSAAAESAKAQTPSVPKKSKSVVNAPATERISRKRSSRANK